MYNSDNCLTAVCSFNIARALVNLIYQVVNPSQALQTHKKPNTARRSVASVIIISGQKWANRVNVVKEHPLP